MARQEQCRLCRGYNAGAGLCTVKWNQIPFDGRDCDQFQEKSNQLHTIETPVNPAESCPDRINVRSRIGKRGKSFDHSNIYVEKLPSAKSNEDNPNRENEFIIEIPAMVPRILGWGLLVLLLCGISYFVYTYIENSREEDRENLVWEARRQMNFINTDGVVSYLRLNNVDYKDHELQLSYTTRIHPVTSTISVDSVIYPEFRSIVALAPNDWDSVFSYLVKADVALRITYNNMLGHPSLRVPCDKLIAKFLDEDMQIKGLDFFVNQKVKEVLNDARKHFRNDFFSPDSLTLTDKYVTLHLSYDDSKAKLGDSYLDTTAVNLHFRDVVGETGTLLDGMWAICSRFQRGFAFVYTGKKSHIVDSVAWGADIAREVYMQNRFAVRGRDKTNNIHTVIRRQKGNE